MLPAAYLPFNYQCVLIVKPTLIGGTNLGVDRKERVQSQALSSIIYHSIGPTLNSSVGPSAILFIAVPISRAH